MYYILYILIFVVEFKIYFIKNFFFKGLIENEIIKGSNFYFDEFLTFFIVLIIRIFFLFR